MKKLILFIVLFLPVAITNTFSQVKKPVDVTTTLTPPYSLYLSDYVKAGSQKCRVTLTFKDYNEPAWDVYIKFKLESSSLKLETKPEYIPVEPITLYPGVPKILSGEDLYPYFNYDNLIFSGISKSELEKNGRLPEGFYTFSFEVYDYHSGRLLSNEAVFTANLQLSDPPSIVRPQKGAIIEPQDAQMIQFQWQMQNIDPLQTSYKLHLFEVTDTSANLETAIQNNLATKIFESEPTNLNLLNYGIDKPLLEEGKTYTFYVQAINAEGKDMFKNGGNSEVSWFHYGYPQNGKIELLHPENGHAFTLREDKVFKWHCPNNLTTGQPYHYEFKLVEYKGDKTPETVIDNEPDFESETGVLFDRSDWHEWLEGFRFKNGYKYAWQVKAFTKDQEIASSDVYMVHGAPFMEAFKAGNHTVFVKKTTKDDIKSLCGEGYIKFDNKGGTHPVFFENITLERKGSALYLEKGKCVAKCNINSIKLYPTYKDNGDAYYKTDSVVLNKNNLMLKGHVEWDLPHPAYDKNKPVVYSKTVLTNYDDFELRGIADIKRNTSFDLLDPDNFRIEFDNQSYFQIYKNNYTIHFYGSMHSKKKVKGIKQDTVRFRFEDQQQLFYMKESYFEFLNHIKPVPYTQLDITPTDVIMDLSEEESPSRFSAQPSWKGIYIEDFIVKYHQFIDDHKQFILEKDIVQNVDVDIDQGFKGWINSQGLQFLIEIPINEDAKGFFNTFPSRLTKLRLNVVNSSVSDSRVKGTIHIPVLSETQQFAYTIPVTDYGFQPGHLDESLDGKTFTHNAEGGEQKMDITINRAVFQEKQYLDMNVDIDWPYINVKFENLNNFRVWGNYEIGFLNPGGVSSLTRQKQTNIKDFDVTIDFIGCGRQASLYAIGTSATIVMADDVAGPEGPPIVNLYSIDENDLLTGNYSTAPDTRYQNVTTGSQGSGTMGGDYSQIGTMEDQTAVLDSVRADMEALKAREAEIEAEINKYTATLAAEKEDRKKEAELYYEISYKTGNSFPDPDKLKKNIKNISKQDVIAVLETIKSFVNEEKKSGIDNLISFANTIENNEIVTFYNTILDYLTDAEQIAKDKVAEVIDKINDEVITTTEQAKADIIGFINQKTDTVDQFITSETAMIIDSVAGIAIREAKKSKSNIDFAAILTDVKESTKKSINRELSRSLNESVKTNLKDPITAFIDTSVTARITGFIDSSLTASAYAVIEDLDKAQLPVDEVANNAKALLPDMKDDFYNEFVGKNGKKVKDRIFELGDDFISGFNWNNVTNDIINDLLGATVEEYIENFIEETATELLSQVGGEEIVGAAAQMVGDNVDMDFSNLGSKLKNGKVDEIIKFDPSYIVVKTKVADFEGYVKMTEDDPVWGDSWQAKLDAKLKVKPEFSATVAYVNGNAPDPSGGDFKYWFLELQVGDLGIPMTPIPLSLDRAGGRLYHHMAKQEDNETYLPDKNTKYGVGLLAGFYDTPSQKTILVFDLELEMAFLTNGFTLEMFGDALIANTIKDGEVTKSVAFADGYLGYNSIEKHFIGDFSATVDQKPLVCAGGDLNIDISKKEWSVEIGTEEQPIFLDLLCTGNPIFESWFNINNNGLEVGLVTGLDLRGDTPWIGPKACRFRAWAEFGFEVGTIVAVVWKPKFGIEKAVIWLEIYAGVGADYKTKLKKGSITFVSVYLYGEAGLETIPKTYVYGKLKGEVTVLCFNLGFNLELDATF